MSTMKAEKPESVPWTQKAKVNETRLLGYFLAFVAGALAVSLYVNVERFYTPVYRASQQARADMILEVAEQDTLDMIAAHEKKRYDLYVEATVERARRESALKVELAGYDAQRISVLGGALKDYPEFLYLSGGQRSLIPPPARSARLGHDVTGGDQPNELGLAPPFVEEGIPIEVSGPFDAGSVESMELPAE